MTAVHISVRKAAKRWSQPVKFHTYAPVVRVAGGEAAWVMWSDLLEIFATSLVAQRGT